MSLAIINAKIQLLEAEIEELRVEKYKADLEENYVLWSCKQVYDRVKQNSSAKSGYRFFVFPVKQATGYKAGDYYSPLKFDFRRDCYCEEGEKPLFIENIGRFNLDDETKFYVPKNQI